MFLEIMIPERPSAAASRASSPAKRSSIDSAAALRQSTGSLDRRSHEFNVKPVAPKQAAPPVASKPNQTPPAAAATTPAVPATAPKAKTLPSRGMGKFIKFIAAVSTNQSRTLLAEFFIDQEHIRAFNKDLAVVVNVDNH
jgi:hypothetical protein